MPAAKIAHGLGLAKNMEVYRRCESFETLKDHKKDFPSIVKRRLLNPSKTDLGVISKHILQKINLKIISITNLNLMRSSEQAIEWFNGLPKNEKLRFLVFDICDYYPSISESLLEKALEFAKQYCTITDEDVQIIMHSRKSLLMHNGKPFVKKDSNGNFDVSQGSYDSCEVSELTGLFLLSQLNEFVEPEKTILYRDDGLMAIKATGRQLDKMRQRLEVKFREFNLKIECMIPKTNVVEYLDIKFNLNDRSYRPYRKPNDFPLYVHAQSNHPPPVLKTLPKNINARISLRSCNEKAFNEEKAIYQNALKKVATILR